VLFHKATVLPSPAPWLSTHSYPTYLRTLIILGLNILFGYNRVRFTPDYKLYGFLTIANAGLVLLLGARNNLLGLVLRIPAPTLLLYHRILGRVTLVQATLHFALTANHHNRTHQLATVLGNTQIQAGVVGWTALAIIAITSISLLRRRTFEAFYYLHFFFLLFTISALIHAVYAREFLIPGFVLWGLDRLVRLTNGFRRLRILSVAHYAGDVTKIKVDGIDRQHAGQIAFLQIPSISFFNWHPFTIASAPEDDAAVFAVRGLGSYTKRIQAVAEYAGSIGNKSTSSNGSSGETLSRHQHPPTGSALCDTNLRIRLDGPYPQGGLQYDQYPVVALVAGGIGITPAISILSRVAHRAAASADKCDNTGGRWHVHLLWVVKDAQHATWFEEELLRASQLMQASGGRATLDVAIFATGKAVEATSEGGERAYGAGGAGSSSYAEGSFMMETPYTYGGPGQLHRGRPNLALWFETIGQQRKGLDAAVNLCGPRRLISDARRAAARASSVDGLFHVEEEVFEF
jgi:NADPH oxidase 2